MKRLAFAAAAPLALGLAMILAACAEGGGQSASVPTRTPPPDPVARFQQLAQLKETASFHVVYRLPTTSGVNELQFAWLQDGQRIRWDQVNTAGGHIGGTSSIDDGAGGGLSCTWATLEGNATADVICSPGPYGWGLEISIGGALNGFFLFPWFVESMEFSGYREVLGVEVECFSTNRRDFRGHICFSSEGVPLEIESEARMGVRIARLSFTAMEIRPPPSEAELLTPIIPDAPLGKGQTLRGVPLDDLVLPPMPVVQQFLSQAGQ